LVILNKFFRIKKIY